MCGNATKKRQATTKSRSNERRNIFQKFDNFSLHMYFFFFLRIHFGDPWDGVANVRIPLSPSINPLLLPINRITTIKSIDWRETRQFALWKFDQKPTDECWKRVSLFFQRMQRPRRINCVTTFVKQTILSFPYYGHFSNNRGTAPQWTYEPVN